MLVDNLVLVILLMFTVMGYRKGVITEFISFSALLFNVVLSKEITPYIVKKLNITVENKFYDIFVYSGIFIATYVIFTLVIKFMLRTVTVNKKLFIDKVTGGLLGLVKAIFINVLLLLVLLVVSKFNREVDKKLSESKSYELFTQFDESTMMFLPEEIKETIKKFDYEKEIDKAIKESLGGKNDKNR
ncbi:MAG: CvpA family protein [Fusobacteriaceae bacterium]|nr:CvpA family protein [Fusobacteriaceae bacterium]MBN2838513.1 CvpA family protein [Fusobacteriaceae bacterium]